MWNHRNYTIYVQSFIYVYVFHSFLEQAFFFLFWGCAKALVESQSHKQGPNPGNSSEHRLLTTRTLGNSPDLTERVKVMPKTEPSVTLLHTCLVYQLSLLSADE